MLQQARKGAVNMRKQVHWVSHIPPRFEILSGSAFSAVDPVNPVQRVFAVFAALREELFHFKFG